MVAMLRSSWPCFACSSSLGHTHKADEGEGTHGHGWVMGLLTKPPTKQQSRKTGHMVTVGADPYESMHWLAQQQRDEQGNTRLRYMDNLTGHLKRTAKASHCLGGVQTGTYYGLWKATAPTIFGKQAHVATTARQLTTPLSGLVLKARLWSTMDANIARK
eukprot:jgi/Chrzof1/4108/UNPLg00770.t1